MPLVHSGWIAWISVDGEELPQYAVNIEERPGVPDLPKFYTVSAWIPSQVGKEFSIHVEHNEKTIRKTDCSIAIHLDGRSLNTRKYFSKQHRVSKIVSGERITNSLKRPFVFSALQLTDQETENNVNLDQIGTIRLYLDRRETNHNSERLSRCHFRASSINQFSVHENTKKVPSHCISLGAPKQCHKSKRIAHSRRIDKDYFLTFIFHYTSANILRAREIMPGAPVVHSKSDAEPTIGSSSNPIEIDTDDEVEVENDQVNAAEQRIQKQMDTSQKELDTLKKRKTDISRNRRSMKKAKIEEDVIPSKLELEID